MKFFHSIIALLLVCVQVAFAQQPQGFVATIDLVNVTNDKVNVRLTPPPISGNVVEFTFPRTVPGTYSTDDYGRFVENVQFISKSGAVLSSEKKGENTWVLSQGAADLATIAYQVNDTYDIEDTHTVFSPSGTNIEAGKNFVLNLHGFVGFVKGMEQLPYKIIINKPKELNGATSMVDENPSPEVDEFVARRYAQLVDCPIQYATSSTADFVVEGMQVSIGVYSPNGVYTAEKFKPVFEKFIQAQKKFMGDLNQTKKYAILIYLSDNTPAVKGFGALEHNESTTVVMPESMPEDQMMKYMTDIVAHEFFHTICPLNIHSEEIHYFDFAAPKMSKHLWLYEGTTEYFANLLQVKSGLIPMEDFMKRMEEKINNSRTRYNDTMSFTTMSANVLNEPWKAQYTNVYEKGALISMCLDLLLLEKSGGKMDLRELIRRLATQYGPDRPFKDEELFASIVALSYPEVGDFLTTYVSGNTAIPYDYFFQKVGILFGKRKIKRLSILESMAPEAFELDQATQRLKFTKAAKFSAFGKKLGLKSGDILMKINDKEAELPALGTLLQSVSEQPQGTPFRMEVKRKGKPVVLKAPLALEEREVNGASPDPTATPQALELRKAWTGPQ